MKFVLLIIATFFIAQPAFALVICEGTGRTGEKIQYTLSDVKGDTIHIKYFILFEKRWN